MVSRVHAAVVAAEELERLLELGATELGAEELGATEEGADEDGATELGALELLGATELGALELAGGGVAPQPIGWVETTMSSIQTSAERPLKLWKPNIT